MSDRTATEHDGPKLLRFRADTDAKARAPRARVPLAASAGYGPLGLVIN